MKKKLLIILILLLLVCGCVNKEKKVVKKKENKNTIKDEIPKYTDLNKTPISFYEVKGNTLTKIHSIDKKLVIEEDIGVFSIYPSNEEQICLNERIAESFYNEWSKYNQNNNLKIGFNIKFNDISFNILSPSDCMAKWEYLYTYLYDDYANRGKSFYSHIEESEYNPNSLFTSIKLQSASKCNEIINKIELSVFTYDSNDDIENNEYRCNSKYTMIINT